MKNNNNNTFLWSVSLYNVHCKHRHIIVPSSDTITDAIISSVSVLLLCRDDVADDDNEIASCCVVVAGSGGDKIFDDEADVDDDDTDACDKFSLPFDFRLESEPATPSSVLLLTIERSISILCCKGICSTKIQKFIINIQTKK